MKLSFESNYEYFKDGCFNCEIYRCFELQKLWQYYKQLFFRGSISRGIYVSITEKFVNELREHKRACDEFEEEWNKQNDRYYKYFKR